MTANVDKEHLKKVFAQLCAFVNENEDWGAKLPYAEEVSFQHDRFGKVVFSLALNKRFHSGLGKEACILKFEVTIGKGSSSGRLSVGDGAEVKAALENYCKDCTSLADELPQYYMGILEYPRV